MSKEDSKKFKYPGKRDAMDGNTAVIMCERESSDAAGAYPITPSTQMGEYWAQETAKGHINISGRPLIFIEPEGEHAAAAVTAGMSMTGLRAINFSSGQGIAYMHESLYAAVGKRLPYILNIGCRAITKHSLNVHAGHDDYHCIDDTGFFQVFGKSAQEAADLNIIAHKIAELSLNPGVVAQDGFLTTHLIESLMIPERELIAEYLGSPEDIIDTPTPSQRMMFGDRRRRIPELWDVDNPVMSGTVQNQDSYMQGIAAQRPYFFDHIEAFADQCFDEFYELTGRRYYRVTPYRVDDAEYLIVGQGSVVSSAEVVADYLRGKGIKVGVLNVTMFRPFPSDLIGKLLKGRKGVVVLERTDQPLAVDLPLVREMRATLNKCLENGLSKDKKPFPNLDSYANPNDAPPLYSGSFGMGSRDLQAEGLIGAVENMLPSGKKIKFFYLGIDFVREKAFTPKQELHQQEILAGYPNVKELAIRGSENPNLMPPNSITVRLHSIGGWGAITTGKNMAMTLFDLLGFHIKANPKYGSEKKGQPTTYYLAAAPEPIRMNCEYFYVDVVLSPDPNVFGHSNPLAGLKKGGVFIIQSDLGSPQAVWDRIPSRFQKIIVDNEIKVYYLDAFKIAREEASDPELQFRMQGNAFQGAFFKASPTAANANLDEETLFKAITDQLQHKFGAKGKRIVEDNVRVVHRGFTEIHEIVEKPLRKDKGEAVRQEADVPMALKLQPVSGMPNTDIHRFWEQTANFYLTGRGNDNLTDPFIGLSCIPVSTGVIRDMTQIRFEHPEWDPEKCVGCAACWTICPDSALPGLVSTIADVLDTAAKRIEEEGHSVKLLRKSFKMLDAKLRAAIMAGEKDPFEKHLQAAIAGTMAETTLSGEEKDQLQKELELLAGELAGFKFSITKPYFRIKEKKAPGSGGLLSITVNPSSCKGCMECVRVCPHFALKPVTQTPETVDALRRAWDFWMKLPTTPSQYMLFDDLNQPKGTLESLLLDKNAYTAMVGGDGACVGCGEKSVLHLFTATVEALMQPRVAEQVKRVDGLIKKLEEHIRARLFESMDTGDTAAITKAMKSLEGKDLTVENLTAALEAEKLNTPLDTVWLRRVTMTLAKLKHLKWCYATGVTGKGRSRMGMINSTGCTSVWGSTFPYNPYPFPWANHLFQDSSSMAMGVFEGHMVKMADGFRAVRIAELELEGKYDAAKHDNFFTYFNWRNFTDDEYLLCPPVVAVGGDGSMFDIGFQNVSRTLMSGKPIKIFIVDTQVYSNTGGQACTSGFTGQISDMAEYGKAFQGKEEIRKEMALIAMAHRTSYVLNGNLSNSSHLIESFVQGLNTRRPALFNVYTPCMPEHGIADDVAKQQAKMALESRAFPLYRYNPDKGVTFEECLDLSGNPRVEQDWPTYTIDYTDADGKPAKMTIPMTFADFAVTEGRFRKQFKKAPADTWNDNMVPIAEFIELPKDARKGKFPYVWVVEKNHTLGRLIVAEPLVKACEERRDFWKLLKSLTGKGEKPAAAKAAAPAAPAAKPESAAVKAAGTGNGYTAPSINKENCSGCGVCVDVNSSVFGLNDESVAVIKDPKGGSYKDIVTAAESCPGQAIKPGTPANPAERGDDDLVKRGEKLN